MSYIQERGREFFFFLNPACFDNYQLKFSTIKIFAGPNIDPQGIPPACANV